MKLSKNWIKNEYVEQFITLTYVHNDNLMAAIWHKPRPYPYSLSHENCMAYLGPGKLNSIEDDLLRSRLTTISVTV